MRIQRGDTDIYSGETDVNGLAAVAVLFKDAGCRLKSLQFNTNQRTPDPSIAEPGRAISMKNIVGLESVFMNIGAWKKVLVNSG